LRFAKGQTRYEIRCYRGDDAQEPDHLIEAKQGEGNAPSYRGTAYVVFERFPLADYGNRVPPFFPSRLCGRLAR
jgi:hypothetical protein